MARKFKEFYEENRLNLSIFSVLIAILIIAWFMFSRGGSLGVGCANYECFQKAMKECNNGVSYVNEDADATWRYKISGRGLNSCEINVRLLNAKEGDLRIDRAVGYEMDCSYGFGITAYPEKDLKKCHGRLKEELQSIVIEKLHAYILENLGEFQEGLAGI
jgi:hypothetical protein